MKKSRHAKDRKKTELRLIGKRQNETRDYDRGKTVAEIIYDDEEKLKSMNVPKAVYRAGILLAIVIVGLGIWLNRSSLTLDSIMGWAKEQTVGSGHGDGFPVALGGNHVEPGNFNRLGADIAALSDTAFTQYTDTGKETSYERHSFETPALKIEHNAAVIYNVGGRGFYTYSDGKISELGRADEKIYVAGVAGNGTYAIGRKGVNYVSELDVYLHTGDKKFNYKFVNDYITAISLNKDGTKGIVCVQNSKQALLQSKLVVFDFSQSKPIAEFIAEDNAIIDMLWANDGIIYVLCDKAAFIASEEDYAFIEHDFSGKNLTAYTFEEQKLTVSVSTYAHSGSCTLIFFSGNEKLKFVDTTDRVNSISAYQGKIAALAGGKVCIYSASDASLLSETEIGRDARKIVLFSESQAYILGISEIRTVTVE